jgi:hypothetical protein
MIRPNGPPRNVLAMHFGDIDSDQMTWTIGAGETKSKNLYLMALRETDLPVFAF